ncbi:MAG: hypothetical protein WBA46_04565 [Thermomicrobiales bacterium]
MSDSTRDRAILQSVAQATTAKTTTEDRLVEFSALIVAVLLEEYQMRGVVPDSMRIATIRGMGALAGLPDEVFARVIDRVAAIAKQAAAASAIAGDVQAASTLMLLKRAKDGK